MCLFLKLDPVPLSGYAKKSEGGGNMSMVLASQGIITGHGTMESGSVLLLSPYLWLLSLLSSATQGKLCLIN